MMHESLFPDKINLPEWPITLIRKASPTDSLWLVGGTVRDLLTNRPLHDWDFVSPASGIRLAKHVANAFKGAFYVLDKNRDTGRAIVHAPGSAQPITLDFAMLRDATLAGDLKKRDFTINAMAMSLAGEVLDPLHCQEDLVKRVIRMTTADCFKQDPLRLIRAIRQSQSLGFSIDSTTLSAICQEAHLINTVSPERILSELSTLLSYAVTPTGMALLDETHLLNHVLPEIKADIPGSNGQWAGETCTWEQTLSALSMADRILSNISSDAHLNNPAARNREPWYEIAPALAEFRLPLRNYFSESVNVDVNRSTLLKWALVMVSVPIKDTLYRLNELRMPNKSISVIEKMIESLPLFQQMSDDVTRSEIYRFFKQTGTVGPAAVIFAVSWILTDPVRIPDPHPISRRTRILMQAYFQQADEFITPSPFLRGDDLIALGVQPGPSMGEILDRLLEAQVTGYVTSRQSAQDFVLNQSILGD